MKSTVFSSLHFIDLGLAQPHQVQDSSILSVSQIYKVSKVKRFACIPQFSLKKYISCKDHRGYRQGRTTFPGQSLRSHEKNRYLCPLHINGKLNCPHKHTTCKNVIHIFLAISYFPEDCSLHMKKLLTHSSVGY